MLNSDVTVKLSMLHSHIFFNADDKACNTLFPDLFLSSFKSFYFVIVVNLLVGKEAVDVNILSYRACILSGFPNVLLWKPFIRFCVYRVLGFAFMVYLVLRSSCIRFCVYLVWRLWFIRFCVNQILRFSCESEYLGIFLNK